ncbi:3130_t:CDS:2, partial [Racocetra fulgida]
VIIIVGGFEIPKNLINILEKAIRDVKATPEILKKAINDVKELPEISEHQEVKKYFQEFDQQLKDLEKVLKIEDFNISDLAFNILFSLANLKTEIFLFIEKANNFDLESIFSNEIDLLTGEIDKYLKFLPKWNSYCTKIINQFEDFNNFINNIKDSLFYFEIQEKLLTKIDKIRKELCDKSKKIDEHKAKKKNIFRQKYYEECAAKRLKLFNSISIQNILDFLKKLNYELEQTDLVDLVEVYKKSELCLKDCCLDYIIENLSKIGCLINNFCKQMVVDKIL